MAPMWWMATWALTVLNGGDLLRSAACRVAPVPARRQATAPGHNTANRQTSEAAQLLPSQPPAGSPQFAWISPGLRSDFLTEGKGTKLYLSFEAAGDDVRLVWSDGYVQGTLIIKSMVLPIKRVGISAEGNQLKITGPNIDVRCDRMVLSDWSQRARLEGSVRLLSPDAGRSPDLITDQVVVDLATGYLELDSVIPFRRAGFVW